MVNGLNYRELQLQIDDKINELVDQIYNEQKNNKGYAEITEDQVIELVKSKFENDQNLKEYLEFGSGNIMSSGLNNGIEQAREMFYWTTSIVILIALENRYTGYMVSIHEYCSPTRHPHAYDAMYRN